MTEQAKAIIAGGVFLLAPVYGLDLSLEQADSLFENEQYLPAESLYRAVLTDASGSDRANALKGMGNIRFSFGRFEEAKKFYDEALAIFKKEKNAEGQARVSINIGSLHYYQGDKAGAMKAYDQALAILKKISNKTEKNTRDEIAVHLNRGQLLEDSGWRDRARESFLTARAMSRSIDYRRGEAEAYYHLASVFSGEGEADSAGACWQAAHEAYLAAGNKKGAADCLREIGNIMRKLSDYTAALEYLHRAMTLLEESKGNEEYILGEAELLNYRGRLQLELGRFREANKDFTRAMVICGRTGDAAGLETSIGNTGLGHMMTGDYDSALYYFNRALPYARDKAAAAHIRQNMGIVFEKQGQFDPAASAYGTARRLYEELGDSLGIAGVLGNIGNLSLRREDYGSAIAAYEQARVLIRGKGRQDWEGDLLANLGIAQRQNRDPDAAQASLEEAIDIIEATRGRISGQEYSAAFFEDKVRVYEELVDIYCDKGNAVEAFNTAERAKARSFLDLFAGLDASRRTGLPADIRALVEEDQRLQKKITLLAGAPDQAGAMAEQRRILTELARIFPEYMTLRSAQPINLGELQSVLDDRTAIVEYFMGSRRGFVFVVTSRSMTARKIDRPAEVIYQAVDSLRREIRRKGDYRRLAGLLYDALLKPAAAEFNTRTRLGIIPHGVLHHLPFAVLAPAETPGGALIDSHDLFYAPSASVFEIAHRKNHGRKAQAAIFAKSSFKEHPDWFDVPLPGTNVEKDSLLKNSVFKNVRVFSDRDSLAPPPTETNARAAMAGFDIIHFATHGKLDSDSPLDSRIVLGVDTVNDGNFRVREIFNSSIDAYLVTLSACETGRLKSFAEGRGYGAGDELTGLSRAFIYAGAASVVASLWKVSDASTGLLMVEFYRCLKNADKAGALCAAQRRLMRSEYYNAPFYWAPFVVIGDWQ